MEGKGGGGCSPVSRKRVATDQRDLCGRREERARVLLSQHPFFALRIESEREMSLMVLLVKESKGPPRQEETPK
jgi:hypothetical protein